jgi:fructosamine-3-kinase
MALWPVRRKRAPRRRDLEAVVWEAFRAPLTAVEPMPDAALGYVYLARLPREPHRAILKWPRHLGCSARERRQLEDLRKHASIRVPEVYLCDPKREVLVLEYLPGVRACDAVQPDAATAERLADDVVNALLAWHRVKHPAGFGPLDGPHCDRWVDYYRQRVVAYHAAICRETSPELRLSGYVREIAERSLARLDEILAPAHREAVLVHSDYHLANLIMDPKTYRLTGAIDPLDAEWADPELDLLHWEWPWGDPQHLLAKYQQHLPLPEGFPLRYACYDLWYAMQNLARLPWHDARVDHRLATALDEAMREFL